MQKCCGRARSSSPTTFSIQIVFFEKEMQTVMKSHCLMPSSLKLGHFDSSVSDSFEHELN